MNNAERIRVFHHVAHKFVDWAYKYYNEDLQQEGQLCAILYTKESLKEYSEKCLIHIRKLLRGFGYVRNLKRFENQIILEMPTKEINKHEIRILELLQILFVSLNMSVRDICDKIGLKYTDKINNIFLECFGEPGMLSENKHNGMSPENVFRELKREISIADIEEPESQIVKLFTNDNFIYLKQNKRNCKK